MIQLVKLFLRKRKAAEEVTCCEFRNSKKKKKNEKEIAKNVVEGRWNLRLKPRAQTAVLSAIVLAKGNRNPRGPDEIWNDNWWNNGYQNWDEDSLKKDSGCLETHLNLS